MQGERRDEERFGGALVFIEVKRLGNRNRHLGSNLKNPLSGEGSLSGARASAKTRGLLVTYVGWRSKALVREPTVRQLKRLRSLPLSR